jgi:hypothetical protein
MIIFNNKGKLSNFIKNGTDTRVFDIHSSVSIEELYDYVLHNEGLPEGVTVAQYNTAESPAQFADIVAADDNVLTAGTVRKWQDSRERSDVISQKEAMKIARRRAASESDSLKLEALFNGFSVVSPDPDEESHLSFGRFTEVDVNRSEFVSHLADALGVYPSLFADADTSLEEKQKLGKDAQRLRWTFSLSEYTVVPPLEQVRVFGALEPYEKGFIADGLFYPGDMLRNACVIKSAHPDFIMTPDNVNGTSFRATAGDALLANARALFAEQYRGNVPGDRIGMFQVYVEAQVLVGITSAEKIVTDFNLNSFRAVAKFGSPVLYALVPHIDFSQCKKDQIYFLATHIRAAELSDFVRFGFGEWFANHRNESLADLTELLLAYRPDEIGRWRSDMTARQIIEDLKTRKGREDCAKFERSYHYHFADNVIAIKGKGLVIKDGPYKMYFLDKADYRNFTVGYDTECCQHWYGGDRMWGEPCVYKLTSDPFAACVVIERAGKILAQSFVWTDEINNTFVFDNIEFANDRVVADYADIIAAFVKEIPYKNVHMGTGYVAGQYVSWGRPLSTGHFNMAQMPTTLDGSSCYTDYHSNARVFKADNMMLIKQSNCHVEHLEEEPTMWDALRDSGARVLLNDYTMTVSERLSFSGRGLEGIDEARRLSLLLRNPILADSMESVPDDWQRQMIAHRVHPKTLQYIKNPIQEVRDLVIPVLPEKVLDWPDATREDWTKALCKEPALTEKYPHEMDTEMASAIYDACGEKALAYIPMSLLNDELLGRIIDRNPRTVLSIDNPSEEVLVRAVTHEPLLLSALPVVTDRVGHAAVTALPAAIIYWPDAPFAECETAVTAQPTLIRNIAHRFPTLRETAIRTNPDAIWAVPNATEEEQALAAQISAEQNGVEAPPVDLSDDAVLGQFAE